VNISILNLNEESSIWWEYLNEFKGLKESKLTWKQFEKYFRKKYLLERDYDGKVKEFHGLKLGQLIMDDHVNRFLELSRYVPYIRY
jgi:hypothetical protein